MNDLLRAISLLTTLQVQPDWDDPAPLGRAMAWYPVVGLLLGVLLALSSGILLHLLPAGVGGGLVRAVLLVVGWAMLTGGLHLDGWADSCDALAAPVDRDKRLEILRDPRLGSFGATGLVLLLLGKVAALAALSGARPLLLAPVLARWCLVLVAASWPSARPGGMGDRFRQGLGAQQLRAASAVALLVAVLAGVPGLLLVGVAWFTARGVARLAAARLGGLTGDVYGATVEAVETAVLLAAVVLETCLWT